MKRFSFFLFLCAIYCASILAAQTAVHVIQKGETLYSIGRKYGLSVDEICAYNSIADATKVKAGQQLKIPSKTASSSVSVQTVPAKPVSTATEDYLVQSGDTFYSLARKHGLSVDELLALNKLASNAVLKTGQRLQLPKKTDLYLPPIDDISVPAITLADPRSYENRKTDSSIIWPIKTKEVIYATGKTFSVMLIGGKGDRVSAIQSGLVIFSGMYRGFGQVVFVHSQPSGHIYVYSGLDSVSVSKGQKVNFGDTLGSLGVDTLSGKAQLNFMVFYNGKPIDPAYAPRG